MFFCGGGLMLRFMSMVAVVVVAVPAQAAVDLVEEDFRLYCGYLDARDKPDMQKLKDKARDAKIAKMAKVKPAVMAAAVERGTKAGASCNEIGKMASADAKAALDANKTLAGRISFFELDASDPSHVVVRVSWLGIDKKKLPEEAALVAGIIAKAAPITKTIALRGVDPSAADKTADEAGWFDAKISRLNASRIEEAKIYEYAATRYIRLFDGVVQR
jgi:hypothetical protein